LIQDHTSFLTWCKEACQGAITVVDLVEVGEFFSELLINKNLDVETLPAVGFEFLKNYFVSINEN
jgi:hypothetical protein